MRLWFTRMFVLALLLAALAAALAWQWLDQALPLRVQTAGEPLLVEVAPKSNARQVAQTLVSAGVETPVWALRLWFRASGQARQIQAGTYELALGTTPRALLHKLITGEQALTRITLLEGWTFQRLRETLNAAPDLRHDSADWSAAELMAAVDRPGEHPEGQFFPDTYVVAKRSSDVVVWRQAAQAMQTALAQAWAARNARCALESPQALLILASVIEKETQHPEDRALVSAVFNNRLRIGMRLQSDPTIIYGLGDQFDGNLRKRDLTTDGPYNSYTRSGLPPTPIAMPSRAALMAAAQPADSDVLYFVGKGGGRSHFSRNLRQHNAAVRRYILGR